MVMLLSALSLRFGERHGRDDVRQASQYLFEEMAKGRTVMWQADMNSLRYYAYRKGGAAMVNAVQRLESEKPSSLFMADVVFLNRPEVAYAGQNHETVLKKNGFRKIHQFTGFEIWEVKY